MGARVGLILVGALAGGLLGCRRQFLWIDTFQPGVMAWLEQDFPARLGVEAEV